MKILVACEESQTVCIAFRNKGHEAYSCDILPCSGGHPEWHIQDDIRNVLRHELHSVFDCRYDMVIAFPPCTDLAVSGAAHFAKKIADGRQKKSIEFFNFFTQLKNMHVAIENPIGIMSSNYRKPDQIVQPFEYGDPYKKSTCLWLKGLPKLIPTNIVEPVFVEYNSKKNKSGKSQYSFMGTMSSSKNPEVARIRSITPKGIAEAMANQWV